MTISYCVLHHTGMLWGMTSRYEVPRHMATQRLSLLWSAPRQAVDVDVVKNLTLGGLKDFTKNIIPWHQTAASIGFFLTHSTDSQTSVSQQLSSARSGLSAQSAPRKAVALVHIILNAPSFNLHSKFWRTLKIWTKSDKQTFTFWRENTDQYRMS